MLFVIALDSSIRIYVACHTLLKQSAQVIYFDQGNGFDYLQQMYYKETRTQSLKRINS